MKTLFDDYFTKSELRERGWTETGIKKFLKSPDRHIENHLYPNAAPMGLFKKSRASRIENSNEYKEWVKRNERKKEGAHKAHQTKMNGLLEELQEYEIEIDEIDRSTLLALTVEHVKQHRSDSMREHLLQVLASDQVAQKVLMVNYLRHSVLCSKDISMKLHHRIGRDAANHRLNQLVCSKIAEIYPYLSEEAYKQREEHMDCSRRSKNVK